MKSQFSIIRILAISKLARGICIFFLPFLLAQNCYYNPVVYDLLNPIKSEDQAAFLSLLGLVPRSFRITGQLMSNGSAVSEATVRVSGSNDSSASSTTDTSGRFQLNAPTGTVTLEVDHMGTVFKIELSITPPIAAIVSIENSTYSVINLEVYPSNAESPTYLELTFSMPYDGLQIDEFNFFGTVSSGFEFQFSEAIELPSDNDIWRAQNFIITPSLSFNSTAISGSTVDIMVDNGSYIPETDYYLTIMPGIKSTSGKSVKMTVIHFYVGALAL
ncbi:hypothetical protein EHQ46_00045 [Leptospira yanagawae]|uniref:Carboxypeptidase regulatory-like domain-containing protein n=1 Tax=Leptospira yanagawae TaxID=293069 RepID=A0ABY2MA15_9LEPT|nr:hypothetical protein [Leptospira yanagawae]TGL25909.1 hypothetical protein EHQ46_00045 [Leptospira yanagawae]